jgi:hypothetical protein
MNADEIEIDFPLFDLDDSSFSAYGKVWYAKTLVKAAKKLPVFHFPLICVDQSACSWSINNVRDFAVHMRRVETCRLKYPVILDEYGFICDGWHRVVKAMLLGRTTVKAVRLLVMPQHDEVIETE